MQIRRCYDDIYVPVDGDTMVQQLPRQLDDDQAFNVNIQNMIHKSTYLSGVVETSVANTIANWVSANAIGDLIEYLQCDKSTPKLEVLLARQNLAISETWMEETMPVNVPGFDLRSYSNTAKSGQIATVSSSSSQNRWSHPI
ncbi:hypothetical protein TNCV_461171 [Trichonephila clavipes]|nr:hypothetical protein TNCV_461171 [Trichonephila clavipes]